MKHKLFFSIIVFLVIALTPSIAFSEATYRSYIYNSWGEAVPTPNAYLPMRFLIGSDMQVGSLDNPRDVFVEKSRNELYIADTGNDRIIRLDKEYNLIEIYDSFAHEGMQTLMDGPKGVFVTESGEMYIADEGNRRVLVTDLDGEVIRIVKTPDTDILPANFIFRPEKVAVDSHGILYVQAFGVYQGLISYNEDGSFNGFFGSNRVEISLQLLSDLFWRRLFTAQQREGMVRYVPTEYSNVFVCSDDFKYATVSYSDLSVEQVRKLNNLGVDIMRVGSHAAPTGQKNYGDFAEWDGRERIVTSLVDIHVDDNGFISVLDASRGRVFQFDQESNLICVFGGKGNQLGTFKNPVAIDVFNEKIIVLDAEKGSITEFSITTFGETIREAILLFNEGLYDMALDPWEEVIKRSTNYELAYVGIGRALYNKHTKEDYREAMRYYRLGYDRAGYSDAFKGYSTEVVRENFGLLVFGLILLTITPKIIISRERILISIKNKFIRFRYKVKKSKKETEGGIG